MRAPLSASAWFLSATSKEQATTVSAWSLASWIFRSTGWVMLAELAAAALWLGDLLPPAFRSEGNKYHLLDEKSASGEALWGKTLNQPLMPQASAMRPTSMASAGMSANSKWGSTTKPLAVPKTG
jgi:hypothetical protein